MDTTNNDAAFWIAGYTDYLRDVVGTADVYPNATVENFGSADNLMIPGAVLDGGGHDMVLPLDGRDQPFDTLDGFERCVLTAATAMAGNRRPGSLA